MIFQKYIVKMKIVVMVPVLHGINALFQDEKAEEYKPMQKMTAPPKK